MKRWLMWLVFAAVGAGCDGGGGPASLPFDPFGTETGGSGAGPGGGGETPPPAAATIGELCAAACTHIDAQCPSSTSGGPGCAGDCASTSIPGCDAQFKAFVACVGTTTLSCEAGNISAPACMSQESAVELCIMSSGGASSRGSGSSGGSAGVSGGV